MLPYLVTLTFTLLVASAVVRYGLKALYRRDVRIVHLVAHWWVTDAPLVLRKSVRALLVCAFVFWVLACGPHVRPMHVTLAHPGAALADILVHSVVVEVLLTLGILLMSITWLFWRTSKGVSALHMVRVTPPPELVAAAVGLVPPDRLFVLVDRRPRALCVGLARPAVYVTTGLLECATQEALRAALAHEEAHRQRRDPLRSLLLRLVMVWLRQTPWVAALAERYTLRSEVHADRFARTCTSTAALASALLLVARNAEVEETRTVSALHESEHLSANLLAAHATGLSGLPGLSGHETKTEGSAPPEGSAQTSMLGDERLHYLTLPCDAPLPPLLPARFTLVGAFLAMGRSTRWSFLALVVFAMVALMSALPAGGALRYTLTCAISI